MATQKNLVYQRVWGFKDEAIGKIYPEWLTFVQSTRNVLQDFKAFNPTESEYQNLIKNIIYGAIPFGQKVYFNIGQSFNAIVKELTKLQGIDNDKSLEKVITVEKIGNMVNTMLQIYKLVESSPPKGKTGGEDDKESEPAPTPPVQPKEDKILCFEFNQQMRNNQPSALNLQTVSQAISNTKNNLLSFTYFPFSDSTVQTIINDIINKAQTKLLTQSEWYDVIWSSIIPAFRLYASKKGDFDSKTTISGDFKIYTAQVYCNLELPDEGEIPDDTELTVEDIISQLTKIDNNITNFEVSIDAQLLDLAQLIIQENNNSTANIQESLLEQSLYITKLVNDGVNLTEKAIEDIANNTVNQLTEQNGKFEQFLTQQSEQELQHIENSINDATNEIKGSIEASVNDISLNLSPLISFLTSLLPAVLPFFSAGSNFFLHNIDHWFDRLNEELLPSDQVDQKTAWIIEFNKKLEEMKQFKSQIED